MNAATINLIIALLPLAEKLVVEIGGKLVEINTSNLTDTATIISSIEAAKSEGFPELKFVSKQA